MATGKNPYGTSYIQTAAGAMITGEIKRYDTYKQMVEDPAPTKLASVNNASQDHQQYLDHELDTDYIVPDEHVGGVLYQRDFINSTWILLYTASDLAIPTYVEWDRILNVPPWVGGVSNHRIKLTSDTYAVPRTTYYSFGNKNDLSKPYRLVLPPDGSAGLKLGDEIVLEQYENIGIVLYEQPDGVLATEYETTVSTDDKTYFVVYTEPYYTFDLDSSGNPIANTAKPLSCNAYRFIFTETDSGVRVWRPCIIKDNINPVITSLRDQDTQHVLNQDPHPVYVRRDELSNYLSVVENATTSKYGKVRLAVKGDIEQKTTGSIAVTPTAIHSYLHEYYSPIDHTHKFVELTEIPFVEKVIRGGNENRNDLIVTPRVLQDYSRIDHIHQIDDIPSLRDELNNRSLVGHTHHFSDVYEDQEPDNTDPTRDLNEVLSNKSDVGHTHNIASIVDYITGIYALNENAHLPFVDSRDCPGGYMKFPVNGILTPNRTDYVVVQWGYGGPISASGGSIPAQGLYSLDSIPYPVDTALFINFSTINDIYSDGKPGSTAIDPGARDGCVQIRSFIRDQKTLLITGFEYYYQLPNNSSPSEKDFRFLWIMIGIERPTADINAQYTIVLESGVSPVVHYDHAQTVDLVRPFGGLATTDVQRERFTKTLYIGMTAGSRANKALMCAQLSSVAETIATRSPGSFTYFIQDSGDGANKADRYCRVDWLRFGINQYASNAVLNSAVDISNWIKPVDDGDAGLLKSLEIPIKHSTYLEDQNYIAIPLSTTSSEIADIELVIEWGETDSSTKQTTFDQSLYSSPDNIEFVDFIGRISPTKNKKNQDVYEDALNWMAQYVAKTTDGFSYFSQLLSSTANPIKYSWMMFGTRAISRQNVTSVGSYDSTNKLIDIPITYTNQQHESKKRHLIIEFGKVTDQSVQNGTDNLYHFTAHRAMPQVLHTSFTMDNPASNTKLDLEAELWQGPNDSYREPEVNTAANTTKVWYSLYRLRSAAASKGSFHWMVVGLTEETTL